MPDIQAYTFAVKRKIFWIFVCFIVQLCHAQSRGGAVVGERGMLTLTHTAGSSQSIVRFVVSKPRPGGPREVTFVVEHGAAGSAPERWAGAGRLLTADGVVAVDGDDGNRRMFKFAGQSAPQSLAARNYTVITAYGIARYADNPAAAGTATVKAGEACEGGGAGATSFTASAGASGMSITCSDGYSACCRYDAAGMPVCRCRK